MKIPKGQHTLEIQNVHLRLLEEQRLILGQTLHVIEYKASRSILVLDKEAIDALFGILDMLDKWSDEYRNQAEEMTLKEVCSHWGCEQIDVYLSRNSLGVAHWINQHSLLTIKVK